MSITLFKTQQLKYSPNAIKHIYFYLYREVNKEVARKQHEVMQSYERPEDWSGGNVVMGDDEWIGMNVKDEYRMFKAVKKNRVATKLDT